MHAGGWAAGWRSQWTTYRGLPALFAGAAVTLISTASFYAARWLYAGSRTVEKRQPVTVLITGAAGQIGYALAPQIARGAMFGPGQPVTLRLLDVERARPLLEGLRCELQDCCYPLLQGVLISTDMHEACDGAEVAVMLAGSVRKAGMTRRDIMAANVSIYRDSAAALALRAAPHVKVVVVASPANTNAWVLQQYAPSIPPENITALTRLDHNRAVAHLADLQGVHASAVHNVVIWGNHASSQVPDVDHGTIDGVHIRQAVSGVPPDYLDHEFVTSVQQRGWSVTKLRGLSPALSAATAICDHMSSWVRGTPPGEWVSMAVPSDGSYGIQPGVVFSFPVCCQGGKWAIKQGLAVRPDKWAAMKGSEAELLEERDLAIDCLQHAAAAATQQAGGGGGGLART